MLDATSFQQPVLPNPPLDFEEISEAASISQSSPLKSLMLEGKTASSLAALAIPLAASIAETKASIQTNEWMCTFSVALVLVGLIMTAAWMTFLGYQLVRLVLLAI